MKIVTIVGARPQFIKAATVSRVLRNRPDMREILIHTGQHYDANMSEIFFRELDIPEPDINLGTGSGSHAVQTAAMLTGIEEALIRIKPDMTLVYGDTNSTMAGAIASVKLHVPVAHVEAGLRSFNRAMPEEINRIVTDSISDLLLAPTETAMSHLAHEGLREHSFFTGDVMYDSVLFYQSMITESKGKYLLPGLPGRYYLATIHRAENTDHPDILSAILNALGKAPWPVVLPIHPRTRKIIGEHMKLPGNIMIIDPVGYLQMLQLTMQAEKVLTDSGGLQKEAYFLGKPCITLRTETEWIETLHDGWNCIAGSDENKIMEALKLPFPSVSSKNAFGTGNAASLIVEKLRSF
jgi:UDP-N-acetylglucosamine 2-epimerase